MATQEECERTVLHEAIRVTVGLTKTRHRRSKLVQLGSAGATIIRQEEQANEDYYAVSLMSKHFFILPLYTVWLEQELHQEDR
jgi:hypothetical protein